MSKFGFDKVLKKFESEKSKLPKIIANDAVRFFNDNFKKGGFEDSSFKAWPEVQRRTPGTSAYKYPKRPGTFGRRTRAMLVKSGRLRRDLVNSVKQATWEKIRFIIEAPYAEVHNEGFNGTQNISAHKRTKMGKALVSSLKTKKEKKIRTKIGESDVKSFVRHIKIPQRKFIGNSKILTGKLKDKILKIIGNTFKK